ncbi:MAG: DUF5926 family protein [Nostocoides sp.]
MGKASRRRKASTTDNGDGSGRAPRRGRGTAAPFVQRPFEGLAGESDLVALREIVPAATATLTTKQGQVVTLATVLPMAWPGLHRADEQVFIAAQTGGSSGDASRDLAAQLLATADQEPGTPLVHPPAVTADTPRLQDLIVNDPVDVTVHEGFQFWVDGQELDADAQASLEQANASAIPTTKLERTPSAYWHRIGDRTHVRLVLPDAEDQATDALARLWAAGSAGLGEATRLLGAFRTCGLLVPVFDLDPTLPADAYEEPLAEWMGRYRASLEDSEPLTGEERRAKSGVLSRQITLR